MFRGLNEVRKACLVVHRSTKIYTTRCCCYYHYDYYYYYYYCMLVFQTSVFHNQE